MCVLPQDDFLSNLTPEAMESLIGYGPAAAFSFIVRVGYAVSMAGSAVLIMFPAREVQSSMHCAQSPAGQPCEREQIVLHEIRSYDRYVLDVLTLSKCSHIGSACAKAAVRS